MTDISQDALIAAFASYSPSDRERSLAIDIIDAVGDPNIDYDGATEAVFLAFNAVRAEAALAEREACAKVADPNIADCSASSMRARNIAAAIRARTATQGEGKTLVSQIVEKGPPYPWEPDEGDIRVGKLPPQPPTSPSQEGGMREALSESLALNENFVSVSEPETLAHLSEYRAVINQARAALAHDGGREG